MVLRILHDLITWHPKPLLKSGTCATIEDRAEPAGGRSEGTSSGPTGEDDSASAPRSCSAACSHRGLTAAAAGFLDQSIRTIKQDSGGASIIELGPLTPHSQSGPAPGTARGGLAPWQKRKIDRYLQEHLAETLHVDDLAHQVLLSISHFCRAFKASVGVTPHTHIIRLRLEFARRLMLTTEMQLSEIAIACGMTDHAHLSKLFRRWHGETPSAWRQRQRIDSQVKSKGRRVT
jgi:AraC family transcriptional regulator